MSDQSAGKSRADICQYAGDEDLLGRSTILEIVHQEGERLIAAQRQRARSILDDASEAQRALLGPPAADAVVGRARRRPAVRRFRGGPSRVGAGPGRVGRDGLPRV